MYNLSYIWRTGRSVIFNVICHLLRLYNTDGRQIKYECGAMVEWCWQCTTEVILEKHVPVPHYPPQVLHWLT
jgi:hypothetical protein